MAWTLDSTHSHVGFSVKHMMVTTVRGQFKTYSGNVNLDTSDFSKSTFDGEIDVTSIDTANADRDNHLRTNDFFDAASHPKIAFKSTKIESLGGNDFKVTGDFTLRGVTKPVTLEVEYLGTSKNPYGKTVAGFSARGSVNRKEYGVVYNAVLETGGIAISDTVKLELDLQAVEG